MNTITLNALKKRLEKYEINDTLGKTNPNTRSNWMDQAPKRTLRVHTGTHKTATSTLQAALRSASESADSRFLYPKTGRLSAWPIAHHDLVAKLLSGSWSVLDDLRTEIDQSDKPIIVLSCEDFSLPKAFFGLNLIRERYADFDIELHTAFRPFTSWAESYFLERTKRDGTNVAPFAFIQEIINSQPYSSILNFHASTGMKCTYYEYKAENYLANIFRGLTGQKIDEKIASSHMNRAYSHELTLFLQRFYAQNRNSSFEIDKILHAAWELEQMLGVVDERREILKYEDYLFINNMLENEKRILGAQFGDMAERLFPKPRAYDDSEVLDSTTDVSFMLLERYFAKFLSIPE